MALLVIGSLTGCRTVRSASEAPEPVLEFAVVGGLEAGRDARLTASRVAAGEVVVNGAISTPTPCYVVRPELALRERIMTLTLEATSRPVICAQALAAFAYQARISHLDSGRYTLDVVARYPGTGWAPRVDRLDLQIP